MIGAQGVEHQHNHVRSLMAGGVGSDKYRDANRGKRKKKYQQLSQADLLWVDARVPEFLARAKEMSGSLPDISNEDRYRIT